MASHAADPPVAGTTPGHHPSPTAPVPSAAKASSLHRLWHPPGGTGHSGTDRAVRPPRLHPGVRPLGSASRDPSPAHGQSAIGLPQPSPYPIPATVIQTESPGASSRTALRASEPVRRLAQLIGHPYAVYPVQASPGQSKSRRETDPHPPRQVPFHQGRNGLRGVVKAQVPCVPKPAVGLNARRKLLRAEGALARAECGPKRPRRAHGVPELPRCMAEVLLGDEVLGNIPVMHVRRQDQLQFALVLVLAPRIPVRPRQVCLAVMS